MIPLIELVTSPPAFMGFGFQEILLVGFVALLVFGGNLPDVMRQLGRTYGKFRRSLHELSAPVRDEIRQAREFQRPERQTASYEQVPAFGDEVPDAETPNPDAPDDEGAEEHGSGEPAADDTNLPGGVVRGATPPEVDDEIDEPPPV